MFYEAVHDLKWAIFAQLLSWHHGQTFSWSRVHFVQVTMKILCMDICFDFGYDPSLLAEALFLVFADGRKETSAMGRKWL